MTKPLAPTTIGERQAIAEGIRKAKVEADKTYGVAWHHLEEISRVELIIAALATTATNAPVADREAVHLTSEEQARLSWIEAELEDEPNRPAYSFNTEGPLCRNGHEVAELLLERAELKLKAAEAAIRQTLPIHGEMREALEQAASDFHLISLHGTMRPMWEDAKAGRNKVLAVLARLKGSHDADQSATCSMNNCRRRCPAGEPFCSEHRATSKSPARNALQGDGL